MQGRWLSVFSFLSRRQHRLSLAPSFLGRGNFHCQGSSHSRPTVLYSGIKEIMKATVDPDSAEGRAEIDRLQHQILQIYQSLRGRLRRENRASLKSQRAVLIQQLESLGMATKEQPWRAAPGRVRRVHSIFKPSPP